MCAYTIFVRLCNRKVEKIIYQEFDHFSWDGAWDGWDV